MAVALTFVGTFLCFCTLCLSLTCLGFRWRRWIDRRGAAGQTVADPGGTEDDSTAELSLWESLQMCFCGIGLQYRLVATRFSTYTPHRGVKVVPVILLIITPVLLSPSVTMYNLGTNSGKVQVQGAIAGCNEKDVEQRLTRIRRVMENETHVELAQSQNRLIGDFFDRLEADIDHYGTDRHPGGCKAHGEDAQHWRARHGSAPLVPSDFCFEAMQAEMDRLRRETCERFVEGSAEVPSVGCYVLSYIRACPSSVTARVPITEACPNHTAIAELKAKHEEHRRRMLEAAKAQQRVPHITPEDYNAEMESVEMIVNKLMFQFDMASHLYTVYQILGMFFPPPLKIHYEPMGLRIHRHLFTVRQVAFIPIVMVLFWVYECISAFYQTPSFHLYLRIMLEEVHVDPCLMNLAYDKEVAKVFTAACNDLQVERATYSNLTSHLAVRLDEVKDFDAACGQHCRFPKQELHMFENPVGGAEEGWVYREELGAWAPDPAAAFRGDPRICEDRAYAHEKLATPPEHAWPFTHMWLYSGALAMASAQFAASTFIPCLVSLVDPLAGHEGMYLRPDARGGAALTPAQEWRVRGLLRLVAWRNFAIWGGLMALILLNLVIAHWVEVSDEDGPKFTQADHTIGTALVHAAFVVPWILLGVVCWLEQEVFRRAGDEHATSDPEAAADEKSAALLDASSRGDSAESGDGEAAAGT